MFRIKIVFCFSSCSTSARLSVALCSCPNTMKPLPWGSFRGICNRLILSHNIIPRMARQRQLGHTKIVCYLIRWREDRKPLSWPVTVMTKSVTNTPTYLRNGKLETSPIYCQHQYSTGNKCISPSGNCHQRAFPQWPTKLPQYHYFLFILQQSFRMAHSANFWC